LRDGEHRPNPKVTYHSQPTYEDFRRSTAQNQHHATFNKKNQRVSPVMRLLTEANFAASLSFVVVIVHSGECSEVYVPGLVHKWGVFMPILKKIEEILIVEPKGAIKLRTE
jgi:hypothetical protein